MSAFNRRKDFSYKMSPDWPLAVSSLTNLHILHLHGESCRQRGMTALAPSTCPSHHAPATSGKVEF